MARKKRMLLIVNPRSGKEKVRNRLLDLVDVFIKEQYQVQIYITQCPLDAANAVLTDGKGKDLIVCSGGDGTLNEVIGGMMRLEKPPLLGYIPSGSTNDFASSLKLPKNMIAAAQIAASGVASAIDIGSFCENAYFVYVAGFGAFTEVSYLTPQDKKNVLGHQAYMLEGLKCLSAMKSYRMRVVYDQGEITGDFIFGLITNTVSVGGFKGLINQKVELDDGVFEVLLVRRPKTALEFSNIVSTILLKGEQHSDMVCKYQTACLDIESEEPVDWVLDGEFGGRHRIVHVENLHRQIRIRKILPSPAADVSV